MIKPCKSSDTQVMRGRYQKQLVTWLKRNKRSVLINLLLVVVVSWAMTRFQLARVQGLSMMPTLDDGQVVLLNKGRLPQRYDLVAFKKDDELLVKRVIGVPGDRLLQSENRLLIETGEGTFDTAYSLTLTPENSSYFINETTIPEGKYFVLGDCVNNSLDSRKIGLIPQESIQGGIFPFLF